MPNSYRPTPPSTPATAEAHSSHPTARLVAINTSRLEAYFFERPRQNIGFSVLETTVQDKLRVWESGPSDEFGPIGGELVHDVDGFIETIRPPSRPRRMSSR